MTPIYSPTHRDVDLFMQKLEEEEQMRQKQAALAYARYQKQGKTFEVTGSTLRRLFFWGAVAIWFVWWIF